VHPVGSYCTDVSGCTVNKTLNLNISLHRRTAKSQNCLDWLWSPPSLIFSSYQGSFPEVKWPEHEIDHSLPPSTEVNNECSYISTAPICLHDMHRGNYAFTVKCLGSDTRSKKTHRHDMAW